jgi:hypothetical protein
VNVSNQQQSLKAEVVSLQYGTQQAITAPENEERFEWDADDSRLKELQQTIRVQTSHASGL